MQKQEIKEMIDEKSDARSLEYFIEKILKPCGFENIVNNNLKDRYARVDIEADKKGVHYNFELKRRRINSFKYSNSVLSVDKFNIMRKMEGKSFYVALYYDKIAFINVKDDSKIDEWKWTTHQKTTDFDKDYMVSEYCPYFTFTKTIDYYD